MALTSLFGGGVVPSTRKAGAAAASTPEHTTAPLQMEELGTTGTPIFGGGFLRDLGEYNSEFQGGPFSSFRVYEEMRRGDSQVAATLAAIKLPIRCAEWAVQAPEDATPAEREAAEFVEDCLREELDFDAALQNALLMLDFGVSAHEDVWSIDGGQVKWKKLAARLPMTFYNWDTDPETEDLVALVQMGYHGGQYVRKIVPVEKLAIFTYQQEGANFSGRSLLRAMYQNWYIKSNLYKVDAIACERNGAGVPVIIMGPDAKTQDIALAKQFVTSLAVHEAAGIALPNNWSFKLEGVTGTLRDPKDSIAHHNMQITNAGLAQFILLGQTQHGTQSLGDTMSDFFGMSLQALANQVARTFSLTSIARLSAYNFPGVRAPRLAPQQILSIKFAGMVDALQKLATSSVLTPDPDIEDWVRRKMGAPEVTAATIAARRPRTVTSGKGGADAPGEPEGAAAGELDQVAASDRRTLKVRLVDGAVHIETAIGNQRPAAKTRRAPRGPEVHLALSDIVSALDKGRDEVAAALRAARPRIQAEILHRLLNKAVKAMHQASVPADGDLISVVEGILRGVSEFGAQQVTEERAKQLRGAGPADAVKVRLSAAGKRDAIGLYADGVVSEFTNTISSRATNEMVSRRVRDDATAGQVFRDVEADLEEQSDKWIDGVAAKGANLSFADGRAEGYEQYKDEVGSVVYSALLDINTCGPCADADGAEGATPDDIPGAPNPDCEGGDRCRCVHVFVFSDEAKSEA